LVGCTEIGSFNRVSISGFKLTYLPKIEMSYGLQREAARSPAKRQRCDVIPAQAVAAGYESDGSQIRWPIGIEIADKPPKLPRLTGSRKTVIHFDSLWTDDK
jgi:hypothetical protein